MRDLKGLSPASCLAFAPDGASLASGHFTGPLRDQPGDFIYLWDPWSGRERLQIATGHGTIGALSFSPDGRLIASCGFDGLVHLWEAASGQERRRYEGHRSWVQSVDFAPNGRHLASASLDGTALVCQVFDSAPRTSSATDLFALWNDLAKDGVAAHRAIGALIAANGATDFLKAHLRPAIKLSDDRVKRWLADLSSPVFKQRKAAEQELARAGELVEAALEPALKTASDPEERRRLTDIRDRVPRPETRPDQLRDLRAVEVLEHIATPEARGLLEELAKAAPEARLTQEAKASLERLAKKPAEMN
jgi:hypothetical protein